MEVNVPWRSSQELNPLFPGVINWVLSLDVLRPIVRISYSVFLLHPAVIALLHGHKRTPGYQTTFNCVSQLPEGHHIFTSLQLQDFIADLPFILLASFAWCLLFEAPFIGLAKLFFRDRALQITHVATLKLA